MLKYHWKKKTRKASVNTDISFAPQENVIMETVRKYLRWIVLWNRYWGKWKWFGSRLLYPSSNGSESFHPEPLEDFHPESLEETRKTRSFSECSDGTIFLVFWSCLTQLLQRCSICLSPAIIERGFVKGTMIIVDLLCKNQHRTTWRSQPINNGMSTGNINISAGILFSGNIFQRIKEIVNIANVAFISQSTFYSIQKKLFYPAIHRFYTTNRALLFESAKE